MEAEIVIICIVSFFAGFIDSIAGGGGLIQTPAILLLFPQFPVATLLGTTKIPSLSGTMFSAYLYSKKVEVNFRIFTILIPAAFAGAFLGSWVITLIEDDFIKPAILVILTLVAIYTFLNKSLGETTYRKTEIRKQMIIGSLFGFVIGFYDGMIGPGTGSFFILAFIVFLGFDFLTAAANAKMLNVATNIASIALFASTGNILYRLAIPMAICNVCGAFLGTKLALLKGNKFIRAFFLIVVVATIMRFAIEIFQ
ncbi:MAG: hypothetical protein CVU11_00685 [Bacteroidetes bacterium HGW-Bacteroidetes-6]|nr:MAG: hypothetical protein CVU11_00685 [Bacteroidetes bacterium HGW-Bacteroidetes-6]